MKELNSHRLRVVLAKKVKLGFREKSSRRNVTVIALATTPRSHRARGPYIGGAQSVDGGDWLCGAINHAPCRQAGELYIAVRVPKACVAIEHQQLLKLFVGKGG